MRAFDHDLAIMADDIRAAYERKNYRASTRFFTYQTPIATDPGGFIPAVVTLETDRDSLFIWCAMSDRVLDMDHGGGQSGHLAVFLRVTVVGTGYKITGNRMAPHSVCTGAGEAPHVFGIPIVLIPGERVTAEWLNVEEQFAGAQLTLIGFKLYTQPYTREILQAVHDQDITFNETAGAP